MWPLGTFLDFLPLLAFTLWVVLSQRGLYLPVLVEQLLLVGGYLVILYVLSTIAVINLKKLAIMSLGADRPQLV